MNKEIFFSVIMPCYNSQEYVLNAIESVQKQTFKGWELIAINDGSTDQTLTILNQKREEDDRVKVFSKENGGYVSAVNLGLTKIKGVYFLLLGSDDQLDTNLFSELMQQCNLNKKQPDIIGFRTRMINYKISEDWASMFFSYQEKYDTDIKEYADMYPKHSDIFVCRDTSKCFKATLLGNVKYLGKYGIGADEVFSMMLVNKAKSFSSVPYFGYLWTIRNGSVSSNITPEKNIDRFSNWYNLYLYFYRRKLFKNIYWEKEYLRLYYKEFKNYCVCLRWRPFFKKYFYIRKNLKIIKKTNNLLKCEIKESFLNFPLSFIIKYKLNKKFKKKNNKNIL